MAQRWQEAAAAGDAGWSDEDEEQARVVYVDDAAEPELPAPVRTLIHLLFHGPCSLAILSKA